MTSRSVFTLEKRKSTLRKLKLRLIRVSTLPMLYVLTFTILCNLSCIFHEFVQFVCIILQSGVPSFEFSKQTTEATIARGGGALFVIDGTSPADGKTSYSFEAMTSLEPLTTPDSVVGDVSVFSTWDVNEMTSDMTLEMTLNDL